MILVDIHRWINKRSGFGASGGSQAQFTPAHLIRSSRFPFFVTLIAASIHWRLSCSFKRCSFSELASLHPLPPGDFTIVFTMSHTASLNEKALASEKLHDVDLVSPEYQQDVESSGAQHGTLKRQLKNRHIAMIRFVSYVLFTAHIMGLISRLIVHQYWWYVFHLLHV